MAEGGGMAEGKAQSHEPWGRLAEVHGCARGAHSQEKAVLGVWPSREEGRFVGARNDASVELGPGGKSHLHYGEWLTRSGPAWLTLSPEEAFHLCCVLRRAVLVPPPPTLDRQAGPPFPRSSVCAEGVMDAAEAQALRSSAPCSVSDFLAALATLGVNIWFPRFVVYCHYRSKGLVVRAGELYGGDFTVYLESPDRVHSHLLVSIPEADGFMDLQLQARIARDVTKRLVLCDVVYEDEEDPDKPTVLELHVR
mmetsp:Transcript_5862/g.17112  ORF Transcript_5862/g.17112 Transcript_5862/m.17112 type:complete len:252 (-) Transcript_5862:307-1062(-)